MEQTAAHRTTAPSTFIKFFKVLSGIFTAAREQDPRIVTLRALYALTDEELAERGLKRSEIGAHVFAGQLHY